MLRRGRAAEQDIRQPAQRIARMAHLFQLGRFKELIMTGPRTQDFPPGLQGGLEHDDEDHRLGEAGQTGPESPGDLNRGHPEQSGAKAEEKKPDDAVPSS